VFVTAWLGVVLVSLTGCMLAAAGAGAGAVAYARGELEASLAGDYDTVVEAARGAVADLEFARISETKDALKAVLVSRTAMDKKVEIALANSGKKLTSIKIRVGILGDEQLSLAILDKIKARL
jgi:hypothetical protein